MPKLIDLTGQKFNRLTVLERDISRKTGRTLWKCQCECGNICVVDAKHLRSGHTKSCGCLQKEKVSKIMKEQIQPLGAKAKEKDLIGQQFGLLTVIEFDCIKNNKKYWKCACQCGNICIGSGSDLVTRHKNSCGCLKISVGELTISNLLKEHNIEFVTEKTFEGCVYKQKLRFDFYVNNNYLIEFDGRQHYEVDNKWTTKESLEENQLRDNIKNEWCKKNNIPLIRIPYTHSREIQIEDLILETTKYRVV